MKLKVNGTIGCSYISERICIHSLLRCVVPQFGYASCLSMYHDHTYRAQAAEHQARGPDLLKFNLLICLSCLHGGRVVQLHYRP